MTLPTLKSPSSLALIFAAILASLTVMSSHAQAQTFANIPALSFTKNFGGPNPLPQVIAVASVGPTFTFSSSATSSGSWLVISPNGGECCTTPAAITVSVNPSISLAAGVYQGSVVLTEWPSATTSITVPVTLTIVSSVPYLDDLPGALSFSFIAGASSPSQNFQIRNAGAGSLSWTLSTSTADGGSWLTVSSSSGTAPSTITVGVNPANLPSGGTSAGDFVGQIVVQAASGNVTIPVNVYVGPSVFTQVDPINFTMPFAGANPLPQVLTIATTGSGLTFSESAFTGNGGNWLQVSPSGGECCVTPGAVTVSINASTLAAGTYTGEIVLTEWPGATLTMVVPVSLTISSSTAPFFGNLPGEMNFSLVAGGTPPAQTIQVRGAGSGTVNWTVTPTTADGGNWLIVNTASGTAPSNLTVSINPLALPGASDTVGTFVGQLLFQSDAGSVETIPVNAVVGPNVFSQINPVNFTMLFAGPNPLPQNITVASSGTAFTYSATAYTSTGGNWLQVTPSGGECCTTPRVMTITVNASTLAAGTYTGEIVLVQWPSSNASMTVPVTLTIAATGSTTYFDNLPGQISFSMQSGQTPSAQTMQVQNAGSGTLNWTLTPTTSDGGNWLIVSPLSGTSPSAVSISVSAEALPNGGLIAGTFTGQLLFQTGLDSVTIPVSVVVGTVIFNQIDPISFTMTSAGANPLPQVLTLASTYGASNFTFSASASTSKGGNWLAISPSGSECCTTPAGVTVSIINANTLAAGTYTGEITFTQWPSGTFSMTVPVTLTVLPSSAAHFDSLPGAMSFSLKAGGSAAPQTFQVRNAGSGVLNWTMYSGTSDGGAWLTATPVSGAAPSTVTVGIVTQNLPGTGQIAGTFTGQLVFQTAGDTVTVPVSVFVGPNVFSQVNPLSFTMGYGAGNPLPQNVTIASTGTNFTMSASAYSATGGNWLQVSPSGVECCTSPRVFTVSVAPATTLPTGTYTGEISLIEWPGGTISMTIPVTLTVAEPAASFFDDIPGQVSFSFAPSSNNPPSQTLQIRNAGFGLLGWTDAYVTSDGGNWLTVSAASGTAPSSVTVGVNVQNLPGNGLLAGTFTGQIVFQSATGNITVPVSVIVGANVFSQLTALSFTVPTSGNPIAQNITVASIGSNFTFSAAASGGRGGNWLSISPSGVECCNTPRSLAVSVNSSALSSGTFTGEIYLTEWGGGTFAMTIPVIVTGKALPATTTVLTSSPNPVSTGQNVTLKATVTPSAATGSVTFVDGTNTIGSANLSGGVATLVVSNFTVGTHALTAVYEGSPSYASSLGTNSLLVNTCVSVSQTPIDLASTGGAVVLTLTTTGTCSWTAAGDSGWIGVSPQSGTGNGTVTVTLGTYVGTADQSGNVDISVAGQGTTAIPVTQRFTAQVFADVLPSYYDFDAVNLLSTEGITSGCSSVPLDFCPTTNIIRSQMAIFMVRAVLHTDSFPYNPVPYFSDVPVGSFGFQWIQKMYELGITSGCAVGLYCPTANVTRAQMAIFLIRMRYGSTYNFDFPPTPYFTDVNSTTFGWSWIQRMKEDNITAGCTVTMYCPNNPVTRGDMATFVMRGAFNELLPATEPILLSISPTTITHGGSPATYTITGFNTHFQNGVTTLGALAGITAGAVTVVNETTLTVQLSAASNAALEPLSPLAITGPPPGNEEAVLPNGLTVQ